MCRWFRDGFQKGTCKLVFYCESYRDLLSRVHGLCHQTVGFCGFNVLIGLRTGHGPTTCSELPQHIGTTLGMTVYARWPGELLVYMMPSIHCICSPESEWTLLLGGSSVFNECSFVPSTLLTKCQFNGKIIKNFKAATTEL